VLCGWVAYAVYGQASQSRALDARVTQLQEQNGILQQQVQERQRQIAEAQTLAWLEEEARKLGYVMPGERVYVVAPPGSAVPKSGGLNAALPTYSPTPAPTPSATPSPAPGVSPAAPTLHPPATP
jgi:hypothetical protein